MFILYPDIKPYQTYQLAVDEPHVLYVEESGSPDGIPVLFVHGGPGVGCDRHDRRFFDPETYRIILFDQRGAGKSKPHATLTSNSTQALLADIETIREKLQIEKWMLFGGSWGSTLSLLYAGAHPERVSGLILRGIFLARKEDMNWLYGDGARRIFPDYWEDFLRPIPVEERDDLVNAFYRRLTGANELAKMSCAKTWAMWEAHCATLRPNSDMMEVLGDSSTAYAQARICTHYMVNNCFLEAGQVLNNADKLKDIPGIIIHGRYDMICPLDNAYALHRAWPRSQFNIVRDAGHFSRDPSIVDALIRATKDMAMRLSDDYPRPA